MPRISGFNTPLLLGFDQFERALARISKKAADGYPPYNIEQVGDDRLCITLAVAGFGEEDLVIEVVDKMKNAGVEQIGFVYELPEREGES